MMSEKAMGGGAAIWIKETSVNTKNGKITYCQLMRTEYQKGSSRQRLVLGLGRTDRLDMDAVREMVAAVNQGRTDVLTPQLLPRFPKTWEYGPVALLLHTFETVGLERFCAEDARRAGLPSQAVDALRSLTAYYLLSYQRGTPFFPWLEQYYVPGGGDLGEEAVSQAVKFFLAPEPLSLSSLVQAPQAMARDEWGFSYAVPCQYSFLHGSPPSDALFLLSGSDIPLACRLWETSPPYQMAEMARRSVLVTRAPDLLERRGLRAGNCRFICAAAPEELAALGLDPEAGEAFLREGGEFAPFREYGYRELALGDLRLFVLRSSPGTAPALTPGHREPRDLILTNTQLPAQKILEKFLILDKVLDITHPVYLVEDLQFLSLEYSREEILAFLSQMQFLQLFLCIHMGARLARCRITLDDALAALGGIRCARLEWPGGGILLTTPATPRQQEILQCGGSG